MVTLHWTTEERAGSVETVALVALVVENSTSTPVRVRVGNRLDGELRPPRGGGVPEAGWDEGVIGGGERRSLGYAVATDGNPRSPPAEIVWTERAPETETSTTDGGHSSDEFGIEPTASDVVRTLGDARPPADAIPTSIRTNLPDAVESWFSAVEARIERYEARDDEMGKRTIAEQTEEQELRRQIATDECTLDSVSRRAGVLGDRIEAISGPESVGGAR
ncbi:hypothetical protein [Haladaptatus sp. DYF46]|uniref:DUF7857 domain-containing protein n=1 Tax=Haladaptatus sp. DYF46 TaxID=2886041 RepID=UPI001E34DBB5|nr:hypothetical protein [Haladaptatus sp. DYF46]